MIDVTNDINSGVQYAWTGELDFNVDAGGTTNGVPADGDLLTIDDGTGKAPVTFEFDSDSSVLGGAAPTVVNTYGNKLNDLTVSGSYTYPTVQNYLVEIDGDGGAADTFRWSRDGGVTWTREKVDITGGAQTIERGLSLTFGATTGHRKGDRWTFRGAPATSSSTGLWVAVLRSKPI